MSSRREVLIRILALLQRKTLIETKNLTFKCLKWHYLTVRSMKNVAMLTEDGAFALFFVPTRGDLTAQESPPNVFSFSHYYTTHFTGHSTIKVNPLFSLTAWKVILSAAFWMQANIQSNSDLDSLCTDVPPPSEKNRFFSVGGGTSVRRLDSDCGQSVANSAVGARVFHFSFFRLLKREPHTPVGRTRN